MIQLTIEEAKAMMGDLISTPRLQDEKYKSAYIDGVLDFFNKVIAKAGKEKA